MIETSRKLLRVFLENMFIPALVGTESLDEAVKMLKEGAVHYVRRRFDADIDLAAMHFGKSTRWIYRVLAKQPADEGSGKGGRKAEGEEAGGNGQYGYALMCAAVEFYHSRRNQALPVAACARALRKDGFDVNAVQLTPLLDMYCGMGYLTKLIEENGGGQDVRYQAQRGILTLASSEQKEEALARVGSRTRMIFPIARAYVEGVPGTYFSEVAGELIPQEYERFTREVREFIAQALSEALIRNQEKNPDSALPEVHFKGLYLMGYGPWNEPLNREPKAESD